MQRRTFLLAFGRNLLADAPGTSQVFSSMATALSEGNASDFLRAIDPMLPGYAKLAANVTASSPERAELLDRDHHPEGDDNAQTVELTGCKSRCD
jgi:hypothetical protein